MLWQVPAISLTAQSFLLTISVGSDTSTLGRCMASVLGLVAALATIQLMLKHRFHEEELSRWLERFASDQRWPLTPHAAPRERERYAHHGDEHPWRATGSEHWYVHWLRSIRCQLADRRSVYVWVGTLAAFAVADALAFVLALTGSL